MRAADTDAAGYDVGVGGGRTTVSLGAASLAADGEVTQKLLNVARDMLEADPETGHAERADRDCRGCKAREQLSRPSPKPRSSTSRSDSGSRQRSAGAGVPQCRAAPPDILSKPSDIPVFAIHECEVAVEPETGHVEVLSYRVVQDVGRALNPRAISAVRFRAASCRAWVMPCTRK